MLAVEVGGHWCSSTARMQGVAWPNVSARRISTATSWCWGSPVAGCRWLPRWPGCCRRHSTSSSCARSEFPGSRSLPWGRSARVTSAFSTKTSLRQTSVEREGLGGPFGRRMARGGAPSPGVSRHPPPRDPGRPHGPDRRRRHRHRGHCAGGVPDRERARSAVESCSLSQWRPWAGLRAFHDVADECIALESPSGFIAVGAHYRDFHPTSDDEVRRCLQSARPDPVQRDISVPVEGGALAGTITLPPHSTGVDRVRPRQR